jgi:hypothetical protein
MKRLLLLTLAAIGFSATASAIQLTCTVTGGTVLTSTNAGIGYSILNGIGNNSGMGTGTISCPSVSVGSGLQIINYQVLATVDYQGGPFGTTSGTSVTQILTLMGGALNGATRNAVISGGNSSSGVIPPTPFQIGTTLNGGTSYGAFTVNVASSVTGGGPVAGSSGQIVLSYDVVPEPSTYFMLSAGLVGFGLMRKRLFRK